MVKTRLLLAAACALLIWGIFQLPKVVVKNEETALNSDSSAAPTKKGQAMAAHAPAPESTLKIIRQLRTNYQEGVKNEKNAIFADSLSHLYSVAANYDSAVWFAE